MKIKFNGEDVEIKVIDNNAKITLMCVHGFGSNKDFIKTFGSNNENFNLISYTVPIIQNMTVDYMVAVAKEVLSHVKHCKVYVMGHSLGGAVVSRLQTNKIKRHFFVSPIHPYIVKFRPYKLLKSALAPKGSIENVVGSIVFAAAKKIPSIDMFVDHDSPWFNIVRNELIDQEFFARLEMDMKNAKNPMFLVGNDDRIISTKNLTEFVEKELSQETIIVVGKHNVFDNDKVSASFNNEIAYKRRIFPKYRKIFIP